jgi:hypothetical protein
MFIKSIKLLLFSFAFLLIPCFARADNNVLSTSTPFIIPTSSPAIIATSSPIAPDVKIFNPAYIIGDAEILDYGSMTAKDIDEFLRAKGGFIATYSAPNPDGKVMPMADIIYDRAVTNKVNPRFLIVLLQKEQGLIEDPNPKQGQLNWAAGYGCPDSGGCNPRWQGIWKQLNSASLQFRDYMDNPQLYKFKAGGTYIFSNPYASNPADQKQISVTITNQATAALYNYTPHIYNGNYNFFNLWQKYFSLNHPDGSLIQAKGEKGVWLIQNGKRRAILSFSALSSRFDPSKILTVNPSDLVRYEVGAPIRFPQYSLARSPDGKIYLLVDDQKRGFDSIEAFRKIGFNPEEVVSSSWNDLAGYTDGAPITASSTYPMGALLQDKKGGGVYWVIDGQKAPLLDKIFLTTNFKNNRIIKVSAKELDSYQKIAPVIFKDGALIKTTSSPAIYVIANGQKLPITSGKLFEKLGYQWNKIITVSEKILNLHPTGEPLTINN